MILHTPISVFKSAQSTEPKTTTLGAFLKSKKWREPIIQLRGIADKKERDQAKKTLPAATISGVFSYRSAEGLQQYNGLICLDFDEKDNPGKTPEEIRENLTEFDEVVYAGLSVSGQGVFAIIATNNTDPAQHSRVVDLLGAILAHYDLYYDRACKDVCRLRFVSYDDDAYWNQNARPFDAAALIQRIREEPDPARRPRARIIPGKQGSAGSATDKKVERYIEAIESRNMDITSNYEEWMRLGMALAREFGPGGEQYFHRISCYHPKYDPREIEKKYAEFCRNTRRIQIGTFFQICNQKGIRL